VEVLRAARGFRGREREHAARGVRVKQEHGLVFSVHVPQRGHQHRVFEDVAEIARMERMSVVQAPRACVLRIPGGAPQRGTSNPTTGGAAKVRPHAHSGAALVSELQPTKAFSIQPLRREAAGRSGEDGSRRRRADPRGRHARDH